MALDVSEKTRLREVILGRFSLNELKDLAFDLGVEYDLLPHETRNVMARELITYFERRNKLDLLITKIVEQHTDDFLARLLAKLPPSKAITKIQIIIAEELLNHTQELKEEIATKFNCSIDEVVLLGATWGNSLHLLMSVPKEAAQSLVQSQADNFIDGEYHINSITLFASLDLSSQSNWRYIFQNYSPIRDGNTLRPSISWEDALNKSPQLEQLQRRKPVNILQNIHTDVARGDSTAVRSHKSFDSQVEAVCHHSGQYLTGEEANHPILQRLITRLLREQHDFPGLPHLDRAFTSAAHANEHQHIVWSRIALQSIALFLPIPLIIILLLALFNLQDYVPLQYWYVFLGALGFFALGSGAASLWAVTRYNRREVLFHKSAGGKPPAVPDYPLQGSYFINASEQIVIDLDNVDAARPIVKQQRGELVVKLETAQAQWEDYAAYQQQYDGLSVGAYMHGGVVALENLRQIRFLDGVPEFDHRIVLRVPVQQLKLHEEGHLPDNLTVKTAYEILPSALYPLFNGLPRFPLEIEPRLSPRDSRTLELRFLWHGPDPTAVCRLDECVLTIPDTLGRVIRVQYGRPDNERQQVVWRNRAFRQRSLHLSITFENPVLACHELLQGHYVFSYEGLLSCIDISSDKVWGALGRLVDKEMWHITRKTTVRGGLTLGLQRLSQEHEYVQAMPPVICDFPPNENLVRAVTEVLLEEGFDLQRVTRTAPRLDPTGRLDKQLLYWDIQGRRYIEELLDAVDVHVVITGSDKIIQASIDDVFQPYAQIDLRARCLHDPRNTSTPKAVDALIGGSGEFSLAAKIRQAVTQNSGVQA